MPDEAPRAGGTGENAERWQALRDLEGWLERPMMVLGVYPHVGPLAVAMLAAGAGVAVFNLGWNLVMQEHIEDRMLSRAYSYDALGSFVAMPLGQLAAGPLDDESHAFSDGTSDHRPRTPQHRVAEDRTG